MKTESRYLAGRQLIVHRAQKTEGVNRTETMRFYPFVSTGNDPRKGRRIPRNEIKYNEQRDEETPIKEDDLFFNVSGATCAAIILFKQIVCQVRDSKQDGSRMWAEKKYVNLPCQSSSSLFYFLLFFFILFGMQRYECFLEWQKLFLGVGKGGLLHDDFELAVDSAAKT